MKKRITVGTLFIILGLLISLGPSTIFAVCGPMDDGKFMKCHWTARAELGIGLGIVLLAVLSIVFASKEVRAGLLLGVATLASISILIPTVLIGVCGGEHMQCNALTRPALLVIGVISIVIALVQAVILLRKKESE